MFLSFEIWLRISLFFSKDSIHSISKLTKTNLELGLLRISRLYLKIKENKDFGQRYILNSHLAHPFA